MSKVTSGPIANPGFQMVVTYDDQLVNWTVNVHVQVDMLEA